MFPKDASAWSLCPEPAVSASAPAPRALRVSGRVANEPEFVFRGPPPASPSMLFMTNHHSLFFPASRKGPSINTSIHTEVQGPKKMCTDPPTNVHISPKLSFEQAELKYRDRKSWQPLHLFLPGCVFMPQNEFCLPLSENLRNVFSEVSSPGPSPRHALRSEA